MSNKIGLKQSSNQEVTQWKESKIIQIFTIGQIKRKTHNQHKKN